jgi:hypothetical protein
MFAQNIDILLLDHNIVIMQKAIVSVFTATKISNLKYWIQYYQKKSGLECMSVLVGGEKVNNLPPTINAKPILCADTDDLWNWWKEM